jgi:predicted ATPase with chaperone activity
MPALTDPPLTDAPPAAGLRPIIPDRFEDLDIPRSLVGDLILRYLWLHGSGTLTSLNETLKLSFPVLETMFHQFRQQQLLEVKGMVGNDYSFTLTAGGREQSTVRSEVCQYVGPAPVSIQQYAKVVKAQVAKVRLSRESLRQAFHDLVLPDPFLDQLGPALIGQQSLFLYGGTGNGKTSIAERILRVYHDNVLVPYAVEVNGHIITVFDPVVHRAVPNDDDTIDPRWVLCERPCITVGGELSAAMLELRLDESTRVFISPCQMKANNGIFIVDDFGRQVLSPRELLNRWIVPLDRRVDYLTLASGLKFQVPFELMVVFSTNLNPSQLADEAFLRRIQTKVMVDNVSNEVFDEIFRRVVEKFQAPAEPGAAEHLRDKCRAASGEHLHACYPMDIYRVVKSISEYEGRPVRMTREAIDRAVSLYFARS